jgi:hypothetical protein
MRKIKLTNKYPVFILLLGMTILSLGFIEGDKSGNKINNRFYKPFNISQEGGKHGDSYRLYVNNINLPMDRAGVLADVNIPPEGTLGRFNESSFLFSGGFMLSGMAGGTLFANAVASASLVEDYTPGTVAGGSSDPNAVMYVVRRSDPPGGQAYQDWADAVALGADFYDVDNDNVYNPDIDIPDLLGDETVWCVYNDGAPQSVRRWNAVGPLGIEVRQTTFALNSKGPIGNIIFIRYRLKYVGQNKANEPDRLTDVYFGTWDDPDIGGLCEPDVALDLVGSDVQRNAIFTYKAAGGTCYGNNPPSFFATFFSGPAEYIPGVTFNDTNGDGEYTEGTDTPIDTAYSVRGRNIGIIEYPGARNQPLSSVVEYFNTFSDPYLNDPNDHVEARNYMLGLKSNGEEVDPCNFAVGNNPPGCETIDPRFWFSGDPVSGTGWLGTQPWDVRQMANTGPFTLWKDTQENRDAGKLIEKEIVVAYVVGRGTDRLNSITVAREINDIAQRIFDNNFPSPPPPPTIAYEVKTGEDFIDLTWLTAADGPLPIGQNPGDNLRYRGEDTVLNINRWVHGFYVNAFRTHASTATVGGENNILELADYSFTNGVDTIRNLYYVASNGGILLRRAVSPDENILDSTLYADPVRGRIRLRITQDPFTEGPLIKGKEYYFGITQYTLNHNAIVNRETGEYGGTGDYLENSAYEEFNLLQPLQDIYEGQTLIITVVFGEDLYNPSVDVVNLPNENHIAGASTGIVAYDVLNIDALSNDEYQITFFKDTESPLYSTYWRLTNITTNSTYIERSNAYTYGETSVADTIWDGFIPRIEDITTTIGTPEYQPEDATWYDEFSRTGNGTGVFYVGTDLTENAVNVGRPPLFPGQKCDQITADKLRRIELRFGTNGKAYRYINGFKGNTQLQSENTFVYAAAIGPSDTVSSGTFIRGPVGNWDLQNDRANGWVDVPFTAWLKDPAFSNQEVQLAVGFLERRKRVTTAADFSKGNPDGEWDPSDSLRSSGEYLFIFNSPYDPNGSQIEFTGGDFSTPGGTVTVWSDLLKASPLAGDIPPDATNVTEEQRLVFDSPYFNSMYVVGLQKQNSTSFYTAGDKFIITLDEYPYTDADVYQFRTGRTITQDQKFELWNKVNVFPNPLFGFNPATSYNNSPADEPFVTFSNLPEQVTIKIYTLSGTLIRTLNTDDKSNPTSPFIRWDLLNESGLRAASGLYIALISALGYGEKVLKFSIIMPQKQLQRY